MTEIDRQVQKHVPDVHEYQEIPLLLTFHRNRAAPRALDQECQVFTRHMIDQGPDSYVLRKYRNAHRVSEGLSLHITDSFDEFLLRFARLHPIATKLVDAYTSIFLRQSVVRRKVILLLAILESYAPTHTCFDEPDSGGKVTIALKLILQCLIFIVNFVLALILFIPVRLALALMELLFGQESE